MGAHRLGEVGTHGTARRSGHHPGADHEPGVVVDPGEDLGPGAVGEQHPAHDVHLPQLHRPAAFPPFEPAVPTASGSRIDQTRTLERPIDPRTRRCRIHPGADRLVHEPARTPVGVAPPGLEHPDLGRRIHLMRAPRRSVGPVREPAEPLGLIPAEPPVHRLARHAEAIRHLDHRNTVTDHREHCLIPLFHDAQLHQHARECVADQAEPASPIRRSRVTRQPEPRSHASGGTTQHSVGRAGLEPATGGL